MKLTSISATNFKGQTFTEELAPVTVFVGANFAGKSARTDAIRLLLLGYLPELGATSKATFGLSSGSELIVSGTFDDGSAINRRWFLRGDSIKKEEQVPAALEAAGQLAVMLNTEEYFAKGPTERVAYVAANCPGDAEFTPELIMQRVNALPGLKWPDQIGMSAQEFVELSIANFADKAKAEKVHADRMEKTVQGLSGIRATDAQTTPITVLEEEYRVKSAEQLTAAGAVGNLEASMSAASKTRQRREAIQRDLARKPDAEAALQARVKLLSDVTNDIDLGDWTDIALLAQSTQLLGDLRAEQQRHESELSACRTILLGAQRALADMANQVLCPYCGACGDGWKALKSAELTQQIAEYEAKATTLTLSIQAAQTARKEAEGQVASGKDAEARKQALERKKTGLESDVRAMREAMRRYDDLEAELARLEPAAGSLSGEELAVAKDRAGKFAAELQEIDGRRKAVLGRQHERQRLAEAETQRDAARAQEVIAKTAVAELKAIQQQMTAAAFIPLVANANRFFGSILKTPIAYNPETLEIGSWRDGIWVGHSTMSGTERSLTYAAISAALTANAPVRAMLIDELARLDSDNIGRLIAAATGAIRDGTLDQFFGIDPRAELYRDVKDSSFKVIRIG